MFELSFSEIEDQIQGLPLQDLAPLRVTVLRNITVEPIKTYWQYGAWKLGRRAELLFAPYDQVLQSVLGEAAGLGPETDAVLVFTKLETLSIGLSRHFAELDSDQLQAEMRRLQQFIDAVLQGIRRRTRATILWHGFERPLWPAFGIIDRQTAAGQTRAIEDLNRYLADALERLGGGYFIDTDLVLTRLGQDRYYDPRYWHIGKAPYSREALKELAREQMKIMRARLGRQRKCLVMDCDNVLWGGIVGEEGPGGIKLGTQYPGSIYREFQEAIAGLHARGVILAICSKNNPQDVWELFRNHADMVLKETMIAAAQINWDDKVTNLRRLSEQLNIGLDSMVFVDDSPFEAGLVKQSLPQVEVIVLPEKHPLDYIRQLLADGLFDSLQWSEEDRTRTAMYRTEAQRREWSQSFSDLAGYLRSLEMEVIIESADASTKARVTQLLLKTNQFNLTTRRYGEPEVSALMQRPDTDLLTLQLKDRFGDYGLVGLAILLYKGEMARIDSLLLSCRVLGRGVEDAFLAICLEQCSRRGAKRVQGRFIPTPKNDQVKDFYPKRGFQATGQEGSEALFERPASPALRVPEHFKAVRFHEGSQHARTK